MAKKNRKKAKRRPVSKVFVSHRDSDHVDHIIDGAFLTDDGQLTVYELKHHGTSWTEPYNAKVLAAYLKAYHAATLPQPRSGIVPGTHAERALRWAFSRKTFDLAFRPSITDMRLEYFESLDHGQRVRAAFRYCVWLFTLLKTLADQIGWSLIAKLINLWKLGS